MMRAGALAPAPSPPAAAEVPADLRYCAGRVAPPRSLPALYSLDQRSAWLAQGARVSAMREAARDDCARKLRALNSWIEDHPRQP
jgi:hypothetical protein